MPLGRGKKTPKFTYRIYRQLGEGDSEAAARRIWQPILLILLSFVISAMVFHQVLSAANFLGSRSGSSGL